MLKGLRRKIEAIDKSIVELLENRAHAAKEIAKVKSRAGLPFHVPGRESKILQRVQKLSKGGFPRKALKAVFREVISGSLSLEQPLTIAYFGQKATFTHQAAMSRYGRSANYIPLPMDEIFIEVEKGNADFGVVPVENSTEGAVNHTLDMFMDTGLVISAEISMGIHHYLLSSERSLASVKRLYCNSQPLGQCRSFVESKLKGRQILEVSSTAEAARMAARGKGGAAIAAEMAAEEYGLRILAKKIEDYRQNVTRFLVIGKQLAERTGADRTSIMFLVKDKVGALFSAIEPFKKHRVNMSGIESRPSKKRPWEYYFFVDVDGHVDDKKLKAALREVKRHCLLVKVLGSYAKAD